MNRDGFCSPAEGSEGGRVWYGIIWYGGTPLCLLGCREIYTFGN
jgi:hypothetical protein